MQTAALPTRPLLSPWHRVARQDGRILLEHAGTLASFGGAAVATLVPALLPLLDGTRTVGETVERLGERVAPAVERALEALAGAGALTEGPALAAEAPSQARTARFLGSLSPKHGPVSVLERVKQSHVTVAGTGASADAVADLLTRSGVGHIDRTSLDDVERRPIDLLIAAPGGAELASLDVINTAVLERPLVWLPIFPYDGRQALVGPLIVAGESCCYRCYALRRASTSGYREELRALEEVPLPDLDTPPLAAMTSAVAAILGLRWLAWRDPELPGRAHAVEQWPTLKVTVHTVHRVPRCPSCSPISRFAAPAPWSEAGPV